MNVITGPSISEKQPPVRGLWLVPAGAVAAAWLAGLIWPRWLMVFGIFDYGTRFLDSYALMAALDAVRAGADPHVANPLDPLMRYHVYSDWWLGLRWFGLGRAQNDWVGAAWVAAFVATACVTMRPRRWSEAAWLTVLLLSPAVALVMNRANNDLVIFVLLAGCGLAAARGGWRLPIAIGLVALASGLKYYPVVAAVPFLWIRRQRGMPWAFLGAILVAGAALAAVWSQVDRGRFMIGSGIYTMGAPLWWRDLGWNDPLPVLPGLVGLGLLAGGLVWLRLTTGLAEHGEPRERMLAAIGACVLLACFLAGMNYAYRWIFVLWPAVWVWRLARDGSLPGRQRLVAGLACGLMVLAVWGDGIFCVFINALPPLDRAKIDHAQLIFRLWTQPLQWLLMGLLAGWLLEGVLVILKGERAGLVKTGLESRQ